MASSLFSKESKKMSNTGMTKEALGYLGEGGDGFSVQFNPILLVSLESNQLNNFLGVQFQFNINSVMMTVILRQFSPIMFELS